MDAITTLGSLIGLAFTSGMRLYSTDLAVGLGIRTGLLDVPASLSHLDVLASTAILLMAGTSYLIEFLADKIPWVDGAWDLVHTFIRPVGAALLGVTAHSPEPISNIGSSPGEVAFVFAGAWLVFNHPLIAAGIALGLVLLILGPVPKLSRLFRRNYGRLVNFIQGGPVPSEPA